MTAGEDLIADARAALAGERLQRAEATTHVPRQPGLYAFYGDDEAWRDLDLAPAEVDQPLYVGKAERSLNGRDVRTHFATRKTGSSTVRRSLAALLATRLGLQAVPRNPDKPDGSANFGLAAPGDELLSQWMEARLRLATWVWPGGEGLGEVETAVLRALTPPLNLAKVGEPRPRLTQARAQMAAEARRYVI